MRIEELIGWETRGYINDLLEGDIDKELNILAQSKLDRDEDRVSVYFKKLYIERLLKLRIKAIISLLSVGDFDELVKIAKDKINLPNAIRQLDKEVELKVEEDGLESIISNFSL